MQVRLNCYTNASLEALTLWGPSRFPADVLQWEASNPLARRNIISNVCSREGAVYLTRKVDQVIIDTAVALKEHAAVLSSDSELQ